VIAWIRATLSPGAFVVRGLDLTILSYLRGDVS
jgi:hypothetical protein